MKNTVKKIHSWMERNLEEPFLKAEMARAEPSEKTNGLSTGVQFTAAAGLAVLVCWVVASAIK
ncbi:MAG: hypothetical protein ACOY40_17615 [Bacillota bacterium]